MQLARGLGRATLQRQGHYVEDPWGSFSADSPSSSLSDSSHGFSEGGLARYRVLHFPTKALKGRTMGTSATTFG